MSEMACDSIGPEEIESEAVFYTQGNDADESANRDPRQRDSPVVSRQMMSEGNMRTPMTLPAERFDLTPIQSMGDSGPMFDFDVLEAKSPGEASIEVPIDYRGEDAHERFRLAELRIVQENVKKIGLRKYPKFLSSILHSKNVSLSLIHIFPYQLTTHLPRITYKLFCYKITKNTFFNQN